MLILKKGTDILTEIGGIKTIEQANAFLKEKCDQESLEKLSTINTKEARMKIANAIAMVEPIGIIPKYDDLKTLFAGIEKNYSKDLYDKHFALYVDRILGRIALQEEAYSKEENLFDVYREQKIALEALKERYGSIVSVEQVEEAASR
jgi:GTP-dependent phosphoenolpyruvate carboxykinase